MNNEKSMLSILREVETALHEVDEEQLDQKGKNILAEAINSFSTTTMQVEIAELSNLSDEFKKNEPELIAASSKLKSDLGDLKDARTVVSGITKALSVITKIAGLLTIGKGPEV